MSVKNGALFYRADRIPSDRLNDLLVPRTFDEVLGFVCDTARAPTYKPDRGSKEAAGCWRAVFSFSVDAFAYDLFFNSPFGYRAQYCQSPMVGVARNQQCVETLFERLMTASLKSKPTVPLEKIATSLRCRSSKIWIDEKAEDCTLKYTITVSDLVAVNVPRWVKAAEEAEQEMKASQRTYPRAKGRAIYGIQAPEGTGLKVLGGFLRDASGEEFVVPSKRRRHQHIQLYGFS